MREEKLSFADASGTQNIQAHLWLPTDEPRLIVQIIHGINEYGGCYENFAHFLTEHGAVVGAHDLMGHGETAAVTDSLGMFPDNGWQCAMADARHFTALLRDRFPGLPLVLLGHSMGSFITRCLLIEYNDDYDGVVLSGTASNLKTLYNVGLAACALEEHRRGKNGRSRLIRDLCFGPYVRKFASEQHPAAWVVSDPELYRKFAKDPWRRFMPSVNMFREMFYGMRRMDAVGGVKRIRRDIPLLLIAGGDDPIGNCGKGVARVYRRFVAANVADAELKIYPGARHEVLNEINKNEVYADIWQWITKRIELL